MNTKTVLIIAGVGLGAYLLYRYTTKPAGSQKQPGTTPTNLGSQGNQQGAPGTTGNGIVDTASAILKGAGSIYSGFENLFGGGSTTSSPSNP